MSNPSTNARTVQRHSPVTGQLLDELPCAEPADVDAAVARARAAQPAWERLGVAGRCAVLRRVRDVVRADPEGLARVVATDNGKPVVEAMMTEVLSVALFIDYYDRHAASILAARRLPSLLPFLPRRSRIERIPVGVVGVIAPWNFPLQLAVVPVLSALYAGCTVVVKPSEVTPLVSRLIERVFSQAGLPDGVVEVVHGDGRTGEALSRAAVDKIFFTGSPATGRRVMQAAAERLVPVELELGGKDAMIVCDDAPLERAANAAVWGGMLNAGQMCIAVERVLVDRAVYPRFIELVRAEVERLVVGGPDDDPDVGPITMDRQAEIIASHVDDAVAQGATAFRPHRVPPTGRFVAPTVLTDVTPSMRVWTDETFGPVLPVMAFDRLDDAIDAANATDYGLTASVFTRDVSRGRAIASRLRAGHVYVNDVVTTVGNPAIPFGGIGRSGFGRYHGPDGLLTFCHARAVTVHPAWPARDPFWFPYRGKLSAARIVFDGIAGGNLLTTLRGLVRLQTAKAPPPIDRSP